MRGTAREHADYRAFSQQCPIRNRGAIAGRARICHHSHGIRYEVSAVDGARLETNSVKPVTNVATG